MARIVGFDPGLHGAAAIMEGRRVLDAIDLPIVGDGSKSELDIGALKAWLERWEPDEAVIENVHAMPSLPGPGGIRRGMGAASSFKFGFACGQLRGMIQCYEIPYDLIVPAVWKKHYGLKGGDKEMSRQLAIRKFPEAGHFMARKMDHQRAEAMLLCAYHIHKLGLLAAA